MKVLEMNVVRTHDKFYAEEDNKGNPKEYFKFILNNAKEYLEDIENPTVLDIGCATGDFLYFFNSIYPNSSKYGMDIMEELLDKAREEVAESTFIKGNIEIEDAIIDIKFDAVFMNGVHSIFDDVRPSLNNIIKILKEGGRAYIFGIFNPEPLDVIIRSRKSNDLGEWEKGWNLFSIDTFSNYLTKLKLKHKFKEFKIGIDIDKNLQDPLRSWTVNMENGEKVIINGLQLIHRFYLLEIINS